MSLNSSNITSGFIDLATFDEIEKYLYGGEDATAYFVRETTKSTWFTQVPVALSRSAGSPEFGQQFSFSISRAGDYLLANWLRVTIPKVSLPTPAPAHTGLRWTRNLGHNLISECAITFNDLIAARFDSYHLDFWSAFTVPASKAAGYAHMIGDRDNLVHSGNGTALNTELPESILNIPLPFFYSRDSGVALPTAALPYNDMRIQFSFRNWNELLIVDSSLDTTAVSKPATSSDLAEVPKLGNTHLWANYAIVSNDERKRMACAPRDILIEQVQTAPKQHFNPANNPNPQVDIRFSHAIKVLFFAARNTSVSSEWSNYATDQASVSSTGIVSFVAANSGDPLLETSLVYENTSRLGNMDSSYYSLVNPWYHAPSIPDPNSLVGYHMYSYSLDFICIEPQGSTNYGKLTNVSLNPLASSRAVTVSGQSGTAGTSAQKQTFDFIVTCVNNNIIRVSGGALGFPVL